MENVQLSVSEFVALLNQTLEYAYPSVIITGEVSNYRVSKNRWVYFDLKDESSSVKFFGTVYQLPGVIEDGMLVQVKGTPRLHNLYGFSVTVQAMQPVGEGSLRKAFELLKVKLDKEGLFAPERKRALPELPSKIGLISSTQAAGYVDFTTILESRWGGMEIAVANVQVQGLAAPRQLISAVEYFNQLAETPEVIVIVRGGGSADDLAAFNDESLVRTIASSRVPVLVGVGHEVDTTLADMVADVRAATPSNAAQLLVPDRRELRADVSAAVGRMILLMERRLRMTRDDTDGDLQQMIDLTDKAYHHEMRRGQQLFAVLTQLDPKAALRRGYAIVRKNGRVVREPPETGATITIETSRFNIEAGVIHASKKTDA